MKDLRTLLPVAKDVLALPLRDLAGYLLEACNADPQSPRQHPKTIRNDVAGWYPAVSPNPVAGRVIAALKLLMREAYIVKTYEDAVDNEWFVLTDKGRAVKRHEEIYEPIEAPESQKPLVFISCGQLTEAQKNVGRQLAKLIEEMTDCDAYFAQEQHSLESLSTNILAALGRCVALVVVMHSRGTVSWPGGSSLRGSVWIEQEIAMAAFLKNVLKRDILVQAYIEKGVQREGLRSLLVLNETEFAADDEIVEDLQARLADGRFAPRAAALPSPETQAAAPSAEDAAFRHDISEIWSDIAGQGGILIFEYVLAFWLIVHPLGRRREIISEKVEREAIEEARLRAGGAYPFGAASDASNLAEGFEVQSMRPRSGDVGELREKYVFHRDGLFMCARISPDDIGEDRQPVPNDRYVRFSTLADTVLDMTRFAAQLVARYDTDSKATIKLTGLANHALVDDSGVIGERRSKPSRQASIEAELSGSAAHFAANGEGWALETTLRAIKALNVSLAPETAEQFVRGYYLTNSAKK